MSALDRVREKYKPFMLGTDKTSRSPSDGFGGPQDQVFESIPSKNQDAEIIDFDSKKTKRDIERNRAAREQRRQQVLAMMAQAPESKRCFCVTDTKAHPDYVILAFAIRDVGSGELSIPSDQYDAFKLLEILAGGAA